MGDFLGLAVSGGRAYAAWTDTRQGNQDVFVSWFGVRNPPTPDNDRFEPNGSPASATELGPVLTRTLPRLHVGPGDTDHFRFQTLSTGTLVIDQTLIAIGERSRVEILDADGITIRAQSVSVRNEAGDIIGRSVAVPCKTGEWFTARVSTAGESATEYMLDIRALTADVGAIADHVEMGAIASGEQAFYRFEPSASGSVQLNLSSSGDPQRQIVVDILDPTTLDVLATGTTTNAAQLAVTRGRPLLARISDTSSAAPQAYSLRLTNFDYFSAAGGRSLLFPAGNGPSKVVSGDVDHDGRDDLVVSNALSDTVSVLLGNGDGSFRAPRQFSVGAFNVSRLGPLIPTFGRDLVLDDFDGDGNLDVAVTNLGSADVSILLGRGDGTFEPQRRFDATVTPTAIDSGDLNNDGFPDLAVIDTSAPLHLSVLLGRGDGTFGRQEKIATELSAAPGAMNPNVRIADLNDDGHADLVYTGALDFKTYVRLGTGDGVTFGPAIASDGGGPGMELADLDGDGKLDLVSANLYTNEVTVAFGSGDGTFSPASVIFGGQSPVDVRVADLASLGRDGSLGQPDGIPDIISIGTGIPQTAFRGPPEIMISPGVIGAAGAIAFGDGVHFADAEQPLNLALGDYDGSGTTDVAFVDGDGMRVNFLARRAVPRNDSRANARDIGTVVHFLQPTLTIVPGHEDVWYTMTAPAEAALDSDDEVLDFSGLFEHESGAGLGMEVLDRAGNVLGSGEHVRVRARQGQRLYVHVFGKTGPDGKRGSGAYTLDVTVLPQLVSVEAQALLPGVTTLAGGPSSVLVLTFQGDRLDRATATDPANYAVTWLGPDGAAGTADDQILPIAGAGTLAAALPAIYNPGANVDVVSGRTYPTAVRQTVTLLFDRPLPAGAYRVQVSPAVRAAAFNESEPALVGDRHGVVRLMPDGTITGGAGLVASSIVSAAAAIGDLGLFGRGTPFLSQLHSDLGALLDQRLSDVGDASGITQTILAQIAARLRSGVGAAGRAFLAIFLDPVGIDLADPTGARLAYSLESGSLANSIDNAFVSVASNVELIIIPAQAGTFTLAVSDVPALARGGGIVFDGQGVLRLSQEITEQLRGGVTSFTFTVPDTAIQSPVDEPRPSPLPKSTPLPSPSPASAPGDVSRLLRPPPALTRAFAPVPFGTTLILAVGERDGPIPQVSSDGSVVGADEYTPPTVRTPVDAPADRAAVTVARFLTAVSSMTAQALAYVRSLLPEDNPAPVNPQPLDDNMQEAPAKPAVVPPTSQPTRRDRSTPGTGAGPNPGGPSSPGATATPSYQTGAALAKAGLGAGALFGGDTRSRGARRRRRRSPTAAGAGGHP